MQIIVVEDEPKLASSLKAGLEADDYFVSVAQTGEEGFVLLCREHFDLAILDVVLPGRNGFEILEAARQQGIRLPVLLLTARDALGDRVRGLDSGADDCLVKPFAFPELLARVRALLRRGAGDVGPKLKLADLEIDLARRLVLRAGQRIDLTSREYGLIEYLFRHRERVVSREMIARDIWKEMTYHTRLDNVIDVHVAHLRKKIDDPFPEKLVETVRGLGFVLREDKK